MLEFETFSDVQVTDNMSVRLPGTAGFLRFRDGEFVSLKKEDRTRITNINNIIKLKSQKTEYLEEGLIALPQNTKNYAHFTRESLPLLHILNSEKVKVPIVVDENFINQRYVSDLIGFFEHLEFQVVPKNKVLVVKKLSVVSNFSSFYNQKKLVGAQILSETREFVRSNLLVKDEGPPEGHSDRIYISRRNVKRSILNEQPIEQVLHDHGFTTVLLEDMAVAEQARMFSHCNVLFSPHGAGLANAFYMPAGSLVIEASYPTPSLQDLNFFLFSSLLGHRHLLVPGQRADWSAPLNRSEDFLLKQEVLTTLLRELLPE